MFVKEFQNLLILQALVAPLNLGAKMSHVPKPLFPFQTLIAPCDSDTKIAHWIYETIV